LVGQIFAFCNAFMEPLQMEDELAHVADDVRTLKPRTVVEIGTAGGGTLYLWTRLAQPDALIVSVDLPGGKFGGGYSRLRTPLYRRFARERQTLHLIRGSSHEGATFAMVKGLLAGAPVDLLFIDGDHTYEGVKEDWEMYSPLVRAGGLVIFHDIARNYGETQVKRHWDAIKDRYPHREYMTAPNGNYGLGVLVV
jgi:predicted O-methyltransferase YrrM